MYQDSYSRGGGPSFQLPPLTPAVKRLLIINAAVFLAIALLIATPLIPGESAAMRALNIHGFLGLGSDKLFDGFGLGLLRLLSYQFVHDFSGIGHLAGNLLMLYFFGTMVESWLGTQAMYRLYLFAGVAGGLGHMLMVAAMGKAGVPVVGASGAVYGILMYAACQAPRQTVLLIFFPIQLAWLVGILIFIGIYASWMEILGITESSVSHGGHLGGALFGFLAFRFRHRLLSPGGALDLGGRLNRWRAQRTHKSDQKEQEVMDQLLDKVKREGMSSLTGAERRFMEKVSKKKSRS